MSGKNWRDRNANGAGKGDRRRPCAISEEEFAANWDAIFGRPFRGLRALTREKMPPGLSTKLLDEVVDVVFKQKEYDRDADVRGWRNG